jgi:hypothetical protein
MRKLDVTYDKQNLPKKLVQEIELIDLLNSFPHLVKPQVYKMKGVNAADIRMNHSDMSFSEYYEYLKGYSGIADVEVKAAKKNLLGKDRPLTVAVYDKAKRTIYSQEAVDAERVRALIASHYTLPRRRTVERTIRSIEDGEYQIDKELSLKTGERFERKRYRYLFLYSTGKKNDLKNCMLAYKLSRDEITEACRQKVWIQEKTKDGKVVNDDVEDPEALKDAKLAPRMVLKRFDIYFTFNNLYRVVLRKM